MKYIPSAALAGLLVATFSLFTCSPMVSAAKAQTYCDAQSDDFSYEWIESVSVADLQNSSDGSAYSDHTALTATLAKGQIINYTLTPGYLGYDYTENWGIFIDFNQNGEFTDPGEKVVSATSNSEVSGSFTLPADALTGPTRMRVIMKYSSAPSPCDFFTYGEVEDYTVVISSDSPEPGEWTQTDLDEIGFQTYKTPGTTMLASTVHENPSYGTQFRHYTYSYEADNGNDGKTQMYFAKYFSPGKNISQAEIIDTETNEVVSTGNCHSTTFDISCSSYLYVPLELEQNSNKTYSIRYTNPSDNTSERFEFTFTLASRKLKR